MSQRNYLANVWVKIMIVLIIGWLLFAVLLDTFAGRMPAFGPGNYSNVIGGFGQIFFLISVQFLAITIFIIIVLYLIAWFTDEYRFIFKPKK